MGNSYVTDTVTKGLSALRYLTFKPRKGKSQTDPGFLIRTSPRLQNGELRSRASLPEFRTVGTRLPSPPPPPPVATPIAEVIFFQRELQQCIQNNNNQ